MGYPHPVLRTGTCPTASNGSSGAAIASDTGGNSCDVGPIRKPPAKGATALTGDEQRALFAALRTSQVAADRDLVDPIIVFVGTGRRAGGCTPRSPMYSTRSPSKVPNKRRAHRVMAQREPQKIPIKLRK
jgi:hypothetical protein